MSTTRQFKVKSTEIVDCNILKVKVGTTGYCGGDSGHGGKSFVEIENEASTDWDIHAARSYDRELEKVRLDFAGDAELTTFIQALRFAADALEELSKE